MGEGEGCRAQDGTSYAPIQQRHENDHIGVVARRILDESLKRESGGGAPAAAEARHERIDGAND